MAFQNNQNFTHPHVLHHLKLDEQKPITCNACEETITTTIPFHGCPSCNFHLHTQCFTSPLYLHHPSHPSHPLTLLPTPTYSSRSFNCDACGFRGNGSCYNCSSCDFDIHLRCANLPMYLHVNEHHHALKLFLTSPYNNSNSGFQCDFCHGMKEGHLWSYYCQECDFGTHVGCAMKFKETTNYGTHSSSTMSEIERLKAISRDKEELDAAILEAKIDAKGRRAALDLWGAGHRRRKGSYYSDSSDDDYY
ncbi:hypothetical protein LIER_31202 [Lithospermum erythrorhizon]|uniref:DC1 domain-containing protein n=1 Tax=Lithospermum erythrorhizon TaxID=34254 RepID=A0AAV3RQ54_LITER